MKLSGQAQAEIIKYAVIGGVVLYVAYKIKTMLNSDKANTLEEGLKNPIDALGAFAGSLVGIEPKVTGGTQLTDNFKYYIELNGGMDKYIAAHNTGSFFAAPYDSNTDYKKLYQQKTQAWFSWGNLF